MADQQNSLSDQSATKRPRTKTEDDSLRGKTQNVILQKIRKLYNNKRLADITLVVGGTSYPSHRLLLSVYSNVFKNMLTNINRNDPNQVVELQEIPQSCIDVFPLFLKYFYTGRMSLEKSIIMPILLLAEKYEVEGITVICVEYMYRHIVDAADQGLLVLWFQYVVSLNQPSADDDSYYSKIWQNTECVDIKSPWNNFFQSCKNYIKWNLHSCNNFNSFQRDVLVGLLKQTDLIIEDEVQLFSFVASWINHQSEEKLLECSNADMVKDYTRSLIEDVMAYIRYPMIFPRQMAELLMVPIVKQNKEFFMNKMAAAMEYYTINMEKQSSTKNVLECTPRLYTSEHWGKSFRTVYQLIEHEFETRSSLFWREDKEEHEMLQWKLKFGKRYIGDPEEGFRVLTKAMRVKIQPKLQQEKGKFSRHVRVTILLYAFQKGIPYVVTIMQNTMLLDANNTYTSGPIKYNAVSGSDKDVVSHHLIPFKLHVIICPAISGVMDAHFGNTIQHVFEHFKTLT